MDDRLEVASRILAGIISYCGRGDEDSQAKQALKYADALIDAHYKTKQKTYPTITGPR